MTPPLPGKLYVSKREGQRCNLLPEAPNAARARIITYRRNRLVAVTPADGASRRRVHRRPGLHGRRRVSL